MKKILSIFAVVCITLLVGYYGSRRHTQQRTYHEKDTLVVGTSADYPPYASIDKDTGEIVGFEIDIAREVCSRLNKKMEVIDTPFTSLIFNLLAETIDIIAAGMTPSERRSKAVLFTQPHLEDDCIVIATKKGTDPITKLEDLHGKALAVNTGYTSDLFLSQYPELNLIKLKAPAELFLALNTGSVDALAIAQSSLQAFLDQQKNHNLQFFTIPDSADIYALAVSKQNTELRDKINAAIAGMKKDGMLEKLKKKWKLS